MAYLQLKDRKRSDYPYMLDYRARWGDADSYRHINNTVHNHLFDSVVNDFLIDRCGFDPALSKQHGVIAHTHLDFYEPIAYPAVLDVGFRVKKLGKSSAVYELAVFARGSEQVKTVGEVVHVFVDRATAKPNANGMMAFIRDGLQQLYDPKSKL